MLNDTESCPADVRRPSATTFDPDITLAMQAKLPEKSARSRHATRKTNALASNTPNPVWVNDALEDIYAE